MVEVEVVVVVVVVVAVVVVVMRRERRRRARVRVTANKGKDDRTLDSTLRPPAPLHSQLVLLHSNHAGSFFFPCSTASPTRSLPIPSQ